MNSPSPDSLTVKLFWSRSYKVFHQIPQEQFPNTCQDAYFLLLGGKHFQTSTRRNINWWREDCENIFGGVASKLAKVEWKQEYGLVHKIGQ